MSGTTAEVQGVTADLSGGKNLLMVDNVDADRQALRVTAVAAMLPLLARGTVAGLETVPAAVTFRRCGEPLPDEQLKLWNRFVCDVVAAK